MILQALDYENQPRRARSRFVNPIACWAGWSNLALVAFASIAIALDEFGIHDSDYHGVKKFVIRAVLIGFAASFWSSALSLVVGSVCCFFQSFRAPRLLIALAIDMGCLLAVLIAAVFAWNQK